MIKQNHSAIECTLKFGPTDVLKILIIRDGRPGHYNQSEGVARAIERLTAISVVYLDVHRRSVLSWHAIYFLYNRRILSDNFFLRWIYPRAVLRNKPDIIISAGGETLLLNAILSRRAGCSNIYSGSLRNLDSRFFSVVLINYSRFDGQAPYIYTLKPCPVDPDAITGTSKAFDLCFLIGGPSGTHSYSQSEWQALFRLIAAAGTGSGIAVLTSRRTPATVVATLKGLSSSSIRIFDYKDVGPGAAFEFCQKAKAILVTEDSNSMITEAVCSQKPVITLAPRMTRMNEDEKEYLLTLKKKKWIGALRLSEDIELFTVHDELEIVRPMRNNHLDALAEKLLERMKIFERTKLSRVRA